MKTVSILFILLFTFAALGAGCLSKETHTRFTPYEAPYSDPFYANDTFADQVFELTMPSGWISEEQADANVVIFKDLASNDHITLQIFTEDDPTGLIRAHMNDVTEEDVVSEYSGTRLTGTGESGDDIQVTHTILATATGWFVFSSEKDNQNYSELMNSLEIK